MWCFSCPFHIPLITRHLRGYEPRVNASTAVIGPGMLAEINFVNIPLLSHPWMLEHILPMHVLPASKDPGHNVEDLKNTDL